jgi:hypothetical protein
VSNRVLQLIAPLPENVDGGLIIRDEHGKPTGLFLFPALSSSRLMQIHPELQDY